MVLINSFRWLLNAYPGKKYFAEYRFLPIFFLGGAALEYLMIHWTVGETNFYRTYKKRQVDEIIECKEKASLLESGLVRIKLRNQ
ncbi:small integral membrane protein 4 [Nasonia vitripennis]|uniref:Small integral membrane protein 4 n=1 Tax=Nasonia vitripennis TaxID=7425 RepID=A0A7M7QPN9_NASVI|nr:small integral membrane protein 4 [Nasonia vitripennis]